MRIALIALSAAALVAGPQAAAQDLVIPYEDLDLSTAKGQKALDRRIESAAREYCGANEVQTGTRVKPTGVSQCIKDTRAAARQQMASLVDKQTALKGG
jgi:UrcA family protein